MQQFTRKPVKVFRWDDTGAPQIGVNTAGDLKTVLKACLNAGYGSKTALGWDIVGEDTNRIAVKSANAASTKSVLWVDDSHGTTAIVRAYESMTDLNTGVGRFQYRYGHSYEYYPKSSSSGSAKWVLIGHDTAFVFLIFPNTNYAKANPLFFGDFPSFKSGDQYNNMLMTWFENRVTQPYFEASYPGIGATYDLRGFTASICRAYNQTTKNAGNVYFSTQAIASGYPERIAGGWMGAPAYIVEAGSYRGILPGITATRSFGSLTQFSFGAMLPQSADTADQFMWVHNHNHNSGNYYIGFVVNTTAWLSP